MKRNEIEGYSNGSSEMRPDDHSDINEELKIKILFMSQSYI